MDNTEKPKSQSVPRGKNGGARPGAGRKKGGRNLSTIQREEALNQFRSRVAKLVHPILNAQYDLAVGEKYLMCVKTIGTGAKTRRETEIVTSPQTIVDYLDGKLDETDETEFYYMTTKPANNMALDSLLNRTFGKPQENASVAITAENPIIFVNEVPSPKAQSNPGELLPDDTSNSRPDTD